jgi:hypothetical protein
VVDIFEEVDEHLRSDRLGVLARRYLPWVLGVLGIALAIALGWWAFTAFQNKAIDAGSRAYADGLDSLTANNLDKAYGQFATAAKSPGEYKALALMQEANVRMNQNRIADAVALFDQAAKATDDPLVQDAARLKSAFALLDTAPYAQIEGRLKPLIDPNRPYHALAREALGMAKLNAGRPQDALGDFQVLSLMADAPADVRQRAQAAMVLIRGGTAQTLPAIVKASISLPPAPPLSAAPAQAAQAAQNPPPQGAPQ